MPRRADEIGDQCAQMLLAHQLARQHVADVQRIGALDARIPHGRKDRVVSNVAQRPLPLLADGGLSNTNDIDWSHLFQRSVRVSECQVSSVKCQVLSNSFSQHLTLDT